MDIRPQKTFRIVRQLARPTSIDPTTFYVQAVIRDSVSDATLQTVNLTDGGSNRFYYDWYVPVDSSGEGRYIDITTSVYEDSGYTTKTSIYGDEVKDYRIIDPRMVLGGSGGGGGADIDYKKVRDIIREEIAKIELPKQKDYSEIIDNVVSLIKKTDSDLSISMADGFSTVQQVTERKITEESDGLSSSIQAISKKIDNLPSQTPIREAITQSKEVAEEGVRLTKETLQAVEKYSKQMSNVEKMLVERIFTLFSEGLKNTLVGEEKKTEEKKKIKWI